VLHCMQCNTQYCTDKGRGAPAQLGDLAEATPPPLNPGRTGGQAVGRTVGQAVGRTGGRAGRRTGGQAGGTAAAHNADSACQSSPRSDPQRRWRLRLSQRFHAESVDGSKVLLVKRADKHAEAEFEGGSCDRKIVGRDSPAATC